MSFSDITVKQRKKEAKVLKTFLVYGFILSLVLHIGIIAAVIFNLLSKKNQVEEQPIEITFIDMPIQEEVKPESKPKKQENPKLDTQEKPVQQELKVNNNQPNTLNETRSINLDNIPVFKSTPQPQNIQQPSKKFEPSIPKASLQPQPSTKANNQSLSTPIPTKKTTSEFKPQPNKPETETSQSIAKNDTETKKPRKTQRKKDKLERQRLRRALKKIPATQQSPVNKKDIEENVDTSSTEQPSPKKENNNDTEAKKPRKTPKSKDKLERQRLRRALKKSPITQQSPVNKKDIEENVDTSLTEQPSPIQENNELKDKLSDIKDNQVNNPIPSEKPSPTDTNRKKPPKKARRRINRQRSRNQRDSKVGEETKKSELVSDLKQAPSNSKLETVLEKPADTQTSQNIPNNDIESNTPETNSNINSSNSNSINKKTNNPETNNIQSDSSITNPESISTSPNPVTTSPLEDIKGNNSVNNNIDTNTKKPNSNSTASTTSDISASENNLASGSAKVSSNGSAACRRCNAVYPKWAQRKRIQGRIVVAVDADAKGNVIPSSIRLVTSSGNEKLDEYHLKRVKKWKLKRSENGQKGVTIGYEHILE